jgi:hypothetical protein
MSKDRRVILFFGFGCRHDILQGLPFGLLCIVVVAAATVPENIMVDGMLFAQ